MRDHQNTRRLLKEDGSPVLERLEVAESAWQRMRGLLGRKGMPAGSGLLIRKCRAIHTIGMVFSIDLLFLDRDGVVLGRAENVGPWSTAAGPRGTRSVLEMPAGELARLEIPDGTRLIASDS